MTWRDRPSGPATGEPGSRVWTVGGLVQAVSDTLAARYGMVVVRGEISGFTKAASGHGYFTLKDESGQSSLRCAMFRRALSQVDFAPGEGQLVEARGQLSIYGARGELQMVVEGLSRAGAGALYEQFLRNKARLEAEGLFDPARKRLISAFPKRVAVVTSLAAAALHDVLTAMKRRSPHVDVVVVPCSVQGAQAPGQIVDALGQIAWWQRQHGDDGLGFDTVILCRGGGSLEDLWSFNDERVVRAVAACPVPLVCGVGHETDVTLADLAADLRAPTPTAAAELVARARDDALDELDALQGVMTRRVHQRLDQDAQRLDRLSLRMARPAQMVLAQRQQLARLAVRLEGGVQQRVALARQDLVARPARLQRAMAHRLQALRQAQVHLGHRLAGLDPRQVLDRGYAWVLQDNGQPLTSVAQARAGQQVRVELRDGQFDATVSNVRPSDQNP
jgi:exodeoxyribonuclease VII large subunit